MQHRFEVGTDIASIGLWDAGLAEADVDAAVGAGKLIAVDTSADGGFVVSVLVNETFAGLAGQRFKKVERPLGLHLSSGQLRLDGVEHLGDSAQADRHTLRLQPGWYRAQVFLNASTPERWEDSQWDAAEAALTPEELARYRRLGRQYNRGCTGAVVAALLVVGVALASAPLRWVFAALLLLVVVYSVWTTRRAVRGTDYLKLHERYEAARESGTPPHLVIELWPSAGPLQGARIELETELSAR